MAEEDTYTPPQAARILRMTRQRVTQMLNAGELEGHQDGSGRWHIPQRAIHERLKDRPERASRGDQWPPETPAAPPELVEEVRALERALGRLEGRLELTEQAESTLREQLERERRRADEERERAERLQREIDESRRSWWQRFFGFQ